MVSGGISFLFMALFYGIIDVLDFKKWAFPFKIIGLNSIFIYMASGLIDFGYTSRYLLNGFIQMAGEDGQKFITQMGILLLEFGLLYFMYKKRIFIKDRKSTRLNSSHVALSYSVCCLKKHT